VKKKKAKVHKAKDTDLREQLNEEDKSLRKALEVDKEVRNDLLQMKESNQADVNSIVYSRKDQ